MGKFSAEQSCLEFLKEVEIVREGWWKTFWEFSVSQKVFTLRCMRCFECY